MNFITYSLDPEIQLVSDLPAGAVFKVTADCALELSLGWRSLKPDDIRRMNFLKMEGSPNSYPVGAIDLATGQQYGFGEGMYRVQRVRSGQVGC
ncbi:MAG: hypothetical protein QG585_484 [Patescibacteria group bacterium]|jgi:hypothetical protein|nr:hypothetical protein [Patescibacteria group bacterium]